MTNEEKARELVSGYGRCCREECRLIALKMAKWKDQQFKEYLEKKKGTLYPGPDDECRCDADVLIDEIIDELFKED